MLFSVSWLLGDVGEIIRSSTVIIIVLFAALSPLLKINIDIWTPELYTTPSISLTKAEWEGSFPSPTRCSSLYISKKCSRALSHRLHSKLMLRCGIHSLTLQAWPDCLSFWSQQYQNWSYLVVPSLIVHSIWTFDCFYPDETSTNPRFIFKQTIKIFKSTAFLSVTPAEPH